MKPDLFGVVFVSIWCVVILWQIFSIIQNRRYLSRSWKWTKVESAREYWFLIIAYCGFLVLGIIMFLRAAALS